MSAEEFEELRPLLFSIAYRILGSVSEAEDAVQETWLRYDASPTDADLDQGVPLGRGDPDLDRRAALGARPAGGVRRAVVARAAADRRRVTSVPDPEHAAELADSVSMAALLLLERLSPLERAVFVLREVFAFPFAEIADGGRQVGGGVPPARRRGRAATWRTGRPRFDGGPPRARGARRAVLRRLDRSATSTGCGSCSPPTSQVVGDGGGKAPQWMRVVVGADNVARMLAGLGRRFAGSGLQVEPHEVNGQPGAIFRDRDGRVINVLALDVLDGRIQTIRSVINPDKLRHLGPVADAWALMRETPPDPGR